MKKYVIYDVYRKVDSRNEFEDVSRFELTKGTESYVKEKVLDNLKRWYPEITLSDEDWEEFKMSGILDLGSEDISDPEWDEEEYGAQWKTEFYWLEIEELRE